MSKMLSGKNVQDMTFYKGILMLFGKIFSKFSLYKSRFRNIRIQAEGVLHMHSSPVTHSGMSLDVSSLTIEGGGKMIGSDLHIEAINLTVDADGELSLTGEGYKYSDGNGQGVNGVINFGRGVVSGTGSSGGGHGGSGGRGSSTKYVGLPYGNLYEPADFGSSGGGETGKSFCLIISYFCRT